MIGNIDDRLEAIQAYEKAKFEYDRAKTALDIAKDTLKEMGTFRFLKRNLSPNL